MDIENKTKRRRTFKKWFMDNIHKPIAEKILYAIFFLDAFVLPIPPDPFLGLMVVFRPQKWVKYSIFTMVISVIGGIVGYLIGAIIFQFWGDSLMNLYHINEQLQTLSDTFNRNSFLAIFIAAFTPIPYQIFTVTAGMFKVNFFIFVIASILGRTLRIFLVAFIMKLVGQKFGDIIIRYLNWIFLLIGALILIHIIFPNIL